MKNTVTSFYKCTSYVALQGFSWVDNKPYFKAHTLWNPQRDWRQPVNVTSCQSWDFTMEWNCTGHLLNDDKTIDTSLMVKQPEMISIKSCVVAVMIGTNDIPWITVPCTLAFRHAAVVCERLNPYNFSKHPAIDDKAADQFIARHTFHPDAEFIDAVRICGGVSCFSVRENDSCLSSAYESKKITRLAAARIQCPNDWTEILDMCFHMIVFTIHSEIAPAVINATSLCQGLAAEIINNTWITHAEQKHFVDNLELWANLLSQRKVKVITKSVYRSSNCIGYQYFSDNKRWHGRRGGFYAQKNESVDCMMHSSHSTVCMKFREESLTLTCQAGQFQCNDGACIVNVYRCDGVMHCFDGSDEMENCTFMCSVGNKTKADNTVESSITESNRWCGSSCEQSSCTCLKSFFQCENGGCVHFSFVCDGRSHCSDMSDERWCHETCDAVWNMLESDNVDTTDQNHIAHVPHDGICLYDRYAEDGYNSSWHLLKSCPLLEPLCPSAFRCSWFSGSHTYCIPFHMVCDNTPDCPRGDDEESCDNLLCEGLFRCTEENICLHQDYLNDGKAHCRLSKEDEGFNQGVPCPSPCSCQGYVMDCDSLALAEVPLSTSFYLKSLIFSNNSYEKSDSPILPQTIACHVLSLYLDSNKLNSVGRNLFRGFRRLLILSLMNNNLSIISPFAFSPLGMLRQLDLSGNTLQILSSNTFVGLMSLSQIDLSKLGIAHIHGCAFLGLKNVQYLSLATNLITSINSRTFCGLENIRHLNLLGNRIVNIDLLSFSALTTLKVLVSDVQQLCCAGEHVKTCHPATPENQTRCPYLLGTPALSWLIRLKSVVVLLVNAVSLVWWTWSVMNKSVRHIGSAVLHIFLNITDFVMGIGLFFIWAVDISYGKGFLLYEDQWRRSLLCVATAILLFCSFVFSAYITCLMGIQRFFLTVLAIKRIHIGQKILFILLGNGMLLTTSLFIFSFWLSASQDYGLSKFKLPNKICLVISTVYPATASLATVAFLLCPIILALVSVTLQVCIVKTLLGAVDRNMKMTKEDPKKIMAYKCMISIGITIFVWMLLVILLVVHLLRNDFSYSSDLPQWIVAVVLPINSLLNPLLNTFSTRNFRDRSLV